MADFLNAVSAVFVIFLLLSVGYLLAHLGWLSKSEKGFISKYVVNIAVPVNCVVGMLKNFSHEAMLEAGINLVVGLLSLAASLTLAAVVATLLKLPRNRWGLFVAMAGISNSLFIGLPVTQQLFGEVSLPYHMTYFLASSVYTQTVAVMLCEQAGVKGSSGHNIGKMLLGMFKKPPVIGICLAITLLLLNIHPPTVLMNAAGYISNTVTPLALMYNGFILYEVGLKNLRFMPGLPLMLLMRLVISPLICFALCSVFGVGGMARDVFVVIAALPVVTQVTVMAGAYGADEQYAAVGSCMSLLGMFVTLPILMILL